MFSGPVLSVTTVTTMFTIPTDDISPYTGGNYVVSMMIHPEGKLWSQAGYDSYGVSPDLTYPDAYYIDRGGDTYSRYYVTGSYGRKRSPYMWLTTGGIGVNQGGDVEEDNNVRYYSYGITLRASVLAEVVYALIDMV